MNKKNLKKRLKLIKTQHKKQMALKHLAGIDEDTLDDSLEVFAEDEVTLGFADGEDDDD